MESHHDLDGARAVPRHGEGARQIVPLDLMADHRVDGVVARRQGIAIDLGELRPGSRSPP